MSKIICDVCGTSYPETSGQCPICGSVRAGNAGVISESGKAGEGTSGYTYVKGGRFSKANVRKRNKGEKIPVVETPIQTEDETDSESGKSSKGLVITAICLMLAIVAVVVFIVFRFFFPELGLNFAGSGKETTETTQMLIPCEELDLDVNHIILNNKGDARMLYANLKPADTTDAVAYSSSDVKVVTVSKEGKIVAVGHGRATITVQCGAFTQECVVECTFEDIEETTEDTTAPTEETTEPVMEFKLNRKDMTLSSKGESWVVYDGKVDASEITWTSDNDSVAKIENGKVTAVGGGVTTVYGEYQGTKVSCIVRCSFTTNNAGVSGSGGGISEDGGGIGEDGGAVSANLSVHTQYGSTGGDITVSVNDVLNMSLKDEGGNSVSGATWSSSDSDVCSVSGSTVTAKASGMATVSATYNGKTYNCKIRVY